MSYNCGINQLKPQKTTIYCGFSSLLDIDKITLDCNFIFVIFRFSSLLDIDKITQTPSLLLVAGSFSSLLDIDKITLYDRNTRAP